MRFLRLLFLITIFNTGHVLAEETIAENGFECGKPSFEPFENIRHQHRVRRIINGINSRPHSWPWLASLKLNGNLHHWCMGFLISRNFILTAAHCLLKVNESNFEVVLGLNELNNYRNAQFIQPKRLILHENFKGMGRAYDIALIELSRPAKLNEYVSLLCLPDVDTIDENFYQKQFFVSGWGVISSTSVKKENSLILKQTTLDIVVDSNCTLNESIFCTLNKIDESNICHGDSGTPLMLKHNNKWYAYGIASIAAFKRHNINLCQNKSPSKFTNIIFFRSWIKSKINTNQISKIIEAESSDSYDSKIIIFVFKYNNSS
jgi:secreted trypsin-like serine protease